MTESTPGPTATLRALGWPEIGPGDDLVALVAAIDDLRDGDVVLVTSKVVSKAEGRLVRDSRQSAIEAETRRVVARRGATVIAETQHGLVMAAAGVDASNTPADTALTLPLDPDRSARDLREDVLDATGLNIAVVVTDTAGRAWRLGQTDMAVGCAGLLPLVDLAGSHDTHGNVLLVTAPAVADELAAAAYLVKGKASGRPVAVVRGFGSMVLPPGGHGPGAAALVRPPAEDLFGLGARDAVVAAALRTDASALDHFPAWSSGDQDPFDGLVEGWRAASGPNEVLVELARDDCPAGATTPTWTLRVDRPEHVGEATLIAVGRLVERAETLATGARLRRHSHEDATIKPGLRPVARLCWQDR